MRKIFRRGLAVFLAVSAVATTAAGAAQPAPTGIWRNPKNSVHVQVQPCGANVCGTVVWANARAREKARKAGTPNLVGQQLFKEFRPAGDGNWRGRVFVPDVARTVSGSLRATGPNTIVASGCIIGRFLCKSQKWARLS